MPDGTLICVRNYFCWRVAKQASYTFALYGAPHIGAVI